MRAHRRYPDAALAAALPGEAADDEQGDTKEQSNAVVCASWLTHCGAATAPA